MNAGQWAVLAWLVWWAVLIVAMLRMGGRR